MNMENFVRFIDWKNDNVGDLTVKEYYDLWQKKGLDDYNKLPKCLIDYSNRYFIINNSRYNGSMYLVKVISCDEYSMKIERYTVRYTADMKFQANYEIVNVGTDYINYYFNQQLKIIANGDKFIKEIDKKTFYGLKRQLFEPLVCNTLTLIDLLNLSKYIDYDIIEINDKINSTIDIEKIILDAEKRDCKLSDLCLEYKKRVGEKINKCKEYLIGKEFLCRSLNEQCVYLYCFNKITRVNGKNTIFFKIYQCYKHDAKDYNFKVYERSLPIEAFSIKLENVSDVTNRKFSEKLENLINESKNIKDKLYNLF